MPRRTIKMADLFCGCGGTSTGSEPLMSVAEFEARFKKLDHFKGLKDAPEPDDGGLFERVLQSLEA